MECRVEGEWDGAGGHGGRGRGYAAALIHSCIQGLVREVSTFDILCSQIGKG